MGGSDARTAFERIARGPDEAIDLVQAALWIAAEEYPGLDVSAYVARLDDLGRSALDAVAEAGRTHEAIVRLNRFLYAECGFAGAREDYYDARNSYLNEVIDRRCGIPITLAIVYLAVARRAGLELRGVGFPGHFLLKTADTQQTLIDPFSGEILDRDECVARYQATLGQPVPFDPRVLDATPSRAILARVLGNLKQIFLARNDFQRALSCSQRILLLFPDLAAELRDRGLLYARLECFAAALEDLERFLALSPGDPNADAIRRQLPSLARRVPSLH